MRAKAPRVKLQLVDARGEQVARRPVYLYVKRTFVAGSWQIVPRTVASEIRTSVPADPAVVLANPNEKRAMKHDSTPCSDDAFMNRTFNEFGTLKVSRAPSSILREGRRS
jgi:hypothetical protein